MDGELPTDGGVRIPVAELTYRATRAGGPGGQHVNTSSTRVEVTWNVAASAALTEEQRALLMRRLASRLDGSGVLRLTSARTRSQARNKEDVTERLEALVARALEPPKPRRRTRPPRAAKEKRLREKKKRSETKELRRPPDDG
jgi:ribosome-associated protein